MSNARFSILQSKAVSDPNITNAQFRTLAALGTFGDKDGWCFPKLATLADMLGKSRQAVSKDLQALQELGYIEIREQRRDDGSRRANLYRIKFDIEAGASQPDVDTHQSQELTPVNPRGLHPSTPEVDAITPHINDSFNVPDEDNNSNAKEGKIYRVYESEIGILTPIISDQLQEWEKSYKEDWILEAIKEAVKNNVRKASYIESILENWRAAGGRTSKPRRSSNGRTAGAKPLPSASTPEEIRRELREAKPII